jgi:hypothetical protein
MEIRIVRRTIYFLIKVAMLPGASFIEDQRKTVDGSILHAELRAEFARAAKIKKDLSWNVARQSTEQGIGSEEWK